MKGAAIILAAGESRRMGRPKALLPFRGGTFLSILAETLGRYCSPVVAVFGYDWMRLSESTPPGVLAIVNPDFEKGMLTSLQAGLRGLGELPERILFTLVDHPAVLPETVWKLAQSSSEIVIPRCEGKRGHPVLLNRKTAAEFLTEPATSKVRDVIDRHAAAIQYMDVADHGIHDDIDDPALYEKLLARENRNGQ